MVGPHKPHCQAATPEATSAAHAYPRADLRGETATVAAEGVWGPVPADHVRCGLPDAPADQVRCGLPGSGPGERCGLLAHPSARCRSVTLHLSLASASSDRASICSR